MSVRSLCVLEVWLNHTGLSMKSTHRESACGNAFSAGARNTTPSTPDTPPIASVWGTERPVGSRLHHEATIDGTCPFSLRLHLLRVASDGMERAICKSVISTWKPGVRQSC